MTSELLTPKKIVDLRIEGQMDPDTLAELLRPWPGNGRTRGPALELVLKSGCMIMPEPITCPKQPVEGDLEVIYTLTIKSERGGVKFEMSIAFRGAITLLDELDNRWKERTDWQSHADYAGLRFRGHTRHLITLKPLVSEYVPVTVELAYAANPGEATSTKPPVEGDPRTLEPHGGPDPR